MLLLGILMGLSDDLNDEEAVILGAGAQGNPPLGCSSSPSSKGSRGRGLNSRLGREEASRTLQEQKTLSTHIPSSTLLLQYLGWP